MSGGKRQKVGDVVLEWCAKYPSVPDLTLARMIHSKNKALGSVSSIRNAVRWHRGSKMNKEKVREKGQRGHKAPNPVGSKAEVSKVAFCYRAPKSYAEAHEDFIIHGAQRILRLSDIHYPFHDERALEAAINYGIKKDPTILLLDGDIIDAHDLSAYERDPRHRYTEIELKMVAGEFEQFKMAFPGARIVYKYGNHCCRLEKYLIRRAPELFGLPGLDLPGLISMAGGPDSIRGVEWVGDDRTIRAGHLSFLHGHEFRGGGGGINPARWLFLRTGESAICFPGETTVVCEDGVRPISSIVVGDRVLTHMGRYMDVVSTSRRLSDATLTISGHGHPCMITTPEHPFLTRKDIRNGSMCISGFEAPEWTPASEIKGLYWSSPCSFPELPIPEMGHNRLVTKRIPFSTGLMWIVGRWLGDGWTSKSSSHVEICCSNDEVGEITSVAESIGLSYGVSTKVSTSVVKFSRRFFAKWLNDNFGKYAHGKTIPSWVLGMRDDWRQSLLDGYLSADGHFPTGNNAPEWECCTVSRSLAFGIKMLAQSLGYHTSVFHEERSASVLFGGRMVNQRNRWRVKAIRSFKRWPKSKIVDGHMLSRVRGMKDSGPMEVFNITVADDSSYVADGLIVHNCGHFHRISEHSETTLSRKQIGTWSTGCLSELSPRYMPNNKWQHGAAYIEVEKDGTFHVDNFRIIDGKIIGR